MYLERLSSYGIDTSPYYEANGKFNTSPSNSDIQMPNCTMYAYCRAFESVNAKAPFPIARNTIGFGNAKTWYSLSPLNKGGVLKTGSIAVFDGTYGHVAYVERVIDDTHAIISESQYDTNKSLRNYRYWQKREVELVIGKSTLNGVGALLGFIYLDIDDVRTTRNFSKEQIEVLEDMVNVRGLPNGEVVRKGCYAPLGIYDIKSKKVVDEYTWYELDKNCWVRQGGWIKYYPVDDELEKLKKENVELKNRLSEIKKLSEVDI